MTNDEMHQETHLKEKQKNLSLLLIGQCFDVFTVDVYQHKTAAFHSQIHTNINTRNIPDINEITEVKMDC